VPLRLASIQREACAFFAANDLQDAGVVVIVIGPIEPSDLSPVQHHTADLDRAINNVCEAVVRRRQFLMYGRVCVHRDSLQRHGHMIPRGGTKVPGRTPV
jgi:hypothetical protein